MVKTKWWSAAKSSWPKWAKRERRKNRDPTLHEPWGYCYLDGDDDYDDVDDDDADNDDDDDDNDNNDDDVNTLIGWWWWWGQK